MASPGLHAPNRAPAPVARLWDLVDQQEWHDVRPLLHPYVHFDDRDVSLRGRNQLLEHLQGHPTPKPPTEVEIRDGQVYRWRR